MVLILAGFLKNYSFRPLIYKENQKIQIADDLTTFLAGYAIKRPEKYQGRFSFSYKIGIFVVLYKILHIKAYI